MILPKRLGFTLLRGIQGNCGTLVSLLRKQGQAASAAQRAVREAQSDLKWRHHLMEVAASSREFSLGIPHAPQAAQQYGGMWGILAEGTVINQPMTQANEEHNEG